jgi:hypothetical protein
VDVDIGSAQQHAVEVEEHQRAAQFLGAVGAQYGLPTNLQVLPPPPKSSLRRRAHTQRLTHEVV